MQFQPANEHAHKFKSVIGMNIMILTLKSEILRTLCITYIRTWDYNTMPLNTVSFLDDIEDQKWIFTLQEKPWVFFF